MISHNNNNHTAYLFVNLGTPDAPTPKAIFPYLSEFLLDRHVVDLPAFLWRPLLEKIILPIRIKKTAENYRKIWLKEGSPLLLYSQRLVENIAAYLPNQHCQLAMTYGNPSLKAALSALQHYSKIKIIPLFPQYSTTTTQAVIDKIKRLIADRQTAPQLEYIMDYADNECYVNALTTQIDQAFYRQGTPDVLVFSYHGIPMRYVITRKDNYPARCQATTCSVTKALRKKGIMVPTLHGYQSRFGKGKWTEPNIISLLSHLAKQGTKHVHVICPGFAVDCVETLEEIAWFNKKIFLNQGGQTFHYISALNDSADHCQLMISLMNKQGTRLN